MPANKLVVQKSARKGFAKLPLNIHKRIVRGLETVRNNPLMGRKLHGELAYYRKFWVGDYRIIYRFEKKTKTVRVVKIEHRRGVYK